MPPPECKGVACGQGSPPLKLEEQSERQTPVPDLQEQRLQVLWTPEGWMGDSGGRGMVSLLGGGEDVGREECDIAPLRSP